MSVFTLPCGYDTLQLAGKVTYVTTLELRVVGIRGSVVAPTYRKEQSMAYVTDYQEGNYASDVDDANLKAFVWNVTTGLVIQNFTGETAWMDAQRKVSDLALADMYG